MQMLLQPLGVRQLLLLWDYGRNCDLGHTTTHPAEKAKRLARAHNFTLTQPPQFEAALIKRNGYRRAPNSYLVAAQVFRFEAKPLRRSLVGSDGRHAKAADQKGGNTRQANRGELSGDDVRCFD